jgi:TRAP-type mannitol/chloroaromatic compound transport system permease small subunit
VINAHPRVDSFTEKLTFRRKAWIELAGCLLLALPYVALIAFHTLDFVGTSYAVGEQSESPFGLTHRWILKSIYSAGIWLVLLGILSVLARLIVFLFGGRSEAEVNLQIGSTTLEI